MSILLQTKNEIYLFLSKNIFLVPFGQDDYVKKPNSLVADMSMIIPSASAALGGIQLQPILC